MQLGHSPVVNVLPTAHRIREMDLPIISIVDVGKGRCHPALGHNGMRLAEQRFTDQPDGYAGCRRFDGRTQTGTTGADDKNVVFECWIISH
jgi:hypothetical protein